MRAFLGSVCFCSTLFDGGVSSCLLSLFNWVWTVCRWILLSGFLFVVSRSSSAWSLSLCQDLSCFVYFVLKIFITTIWQSAFWFVHAISFESRARVTFFFLLEQGYKTPREVLVERLFIDIFYCVFKTRYKIVFRSNVWKIRGKWFLWDFCLFILRVFSVWGYIFGVK